MKKLILTIATLIITSCANNPYKVTLNNNVIYSPSAIISEGILADANLQGCLNQVFISSGNDDPESITLLACPSAGIQSLVGIDALINLEQLDFSGNAISDLSPLLTLTKLRVLSIRNNKLTNISSLQSLPIIRFVSLQGNNSISCRQLDRLEEKIGNTLNRPINCR
jgi:Leucine-rich repeat (LRR) protein